jgi:hypothetical protein
MIIISAGMQKAGTGWFFNMTNDMLVAAGAQDVRQVREKYYLHPILKYRNCNTGRLLFPKMAILLIPSILGHTFQVKTHEGPTPTWRTLSRFGLSKSLYIYRDPRDAALSAYEHGRRIAESGGTIAFAKYATLNATICAAKKWCDVWEAWSNQSDTLLVKYENLIQNPFHELERVLDFLRLTISRNDVHKFANRYQRDNLDEQQANITHLNKGVVGRFKMEADFEQQDLARIELGPYLVKMGYESPNED